MTKQATASRRAAPGRSSRKARQAAARRRREHVRWITLGAIGAVVFIVAAMATAAVVRTPATSAGSESAGAAGELVQTVPVSVLRDVGAGEKVALPSALPQGTPALERDGRAEILYVGAEYCPYCAAERWPLIVALSRFGRFADLGGTASAANDAFPNTPTFSFHGATFTSDVVAFTGVETNTNQPDPSGGYTPLDQLTPEQQALLQRYDVAPYTSSPGSIPFLLIGNSFVVAGSSFDPAVLGGMTRDEIAQALSDPNSPIAQSVGGTANTLTAAICQATGGKPSSVCMDPTIAKIVATLPAAP